jgi:hypothetical protein
MWCIVECVYFLNEDAEEVVDVHGGYATQEDAKAAIRELRARDREAGLRYANYTVMPLRTP